MLTGADVAKHSTKDDLWMIIHGKVYDLTSFAPEHPGGMKILLKYGGKDATAEFDPIHPPGTLEENLSPDKILGEVDMATVEVVEEEAAPLLVEGQAPTLGMCLNVWDIEKAAEAILKPKAFAYYASAADDELTKNWNNESFSKIRLRPRVLRDVTDADLSTTILGTRSSLPLFIAPAAMGRLAHPEGERCLARTAASYGFPYCVSANSSISFEEIASLPTSSPQNLFYQLYVNKDRSKTEDVLRRVVAAGYKAIFVTVDAPVAGKRERDERSKMDADSASDPSMRDVVSTSTAPDQPLAAGAPKEEAPAASSLASAMFSYVDARLEWKDIAWIRKVTEDKLPIVVKGVQSAEDAKLCALYGAKGIYLSNHGGRQLEGAPSSIETLLEIRKFEPEVIQQCEIYLDGGFKRGTDVLKALALGATAVGIGRPFMMALCFGDNGTNKVASIFQGELAQNLRLLGATRIDQLVPSMVNATELEKNVWDGEYVSPSRPKSKL